MFDRLARAAVTLLLLFVLLAALIPHVAATVGRLVSGTTGLLLVPPTMVFVLGILIRLGRTVGQGSASAVYDRHRTRERIRTAVRIVADDVPRHRSPSTHSDDDPPLGFEGDQS